MSGVEIKIPIIGDTYNSYPKAKLIFSINSFDEVVVNIDDHHREITIKKEDIKYEKNIY